MKLFIPLSVVMCIAFGTCSAHTYLETDICTLSKAVGRCKAYFVRWYFDHSTGLCKQFVYGGCGGNGNNFNTQRQCLLRCGCNARTVCKLPKVIGRCKALIPKYYFNYRTGLCTKFYYGGCGANKNNFRTLRECRNCCSRY